MRSAFSVDSCVIMISYKSTSFSCGELGDVSGGVNGMNGAGAGSAPRS